MLAVQWGCAPTTSRGVRSPPPTRPSPHRTPQIANPALRRAQSSTEPTCWQYRGRFGGGLARGHGAGHSPCALKPGHDEAAVGLKGGRRRCVCFADDVDQDGLDLEGDAGGVAGAVACYAYYRFSTAFSSPLRSLDKSVAPKPEASVGSANTYRSRISTSQTASLMAKLKMCPP
jgi:hypothetical protein